jgi:hypothetical protein
MTVVDQDGRTSKSRDGNRPGTTSRPAITADTAGAER